MLNYAEGEDVWEFRSGTIFMEKKLVPKDLGFPAWTDTTKRDQRGSSWLRTTQELYQKHHVYETTDAKGDTVYYAHKDSL